ncbi:hypothetical protein MGN70_002496 [Eutypa lata]|nr:hypothetical protein MGN70_002496 [Eutypa lata]
MADTKEYLERIPTGGIPDESLSSKEESQIPRDYAGAQAKTDPEEIRLVRRLDYRIMNGIRVTSFLPQPILWLMYFFNYVDRGALAQARLNDFEVHLGMSGNDFNVAVSILTVGYVLMQVPSNMLLTRVRPSIYLATCMIVWSTISACTGLVSSYGSLIACRFLLGFFEAPFYPGALYLLAIFYTRKEVATRVAILYTANIGGLSFANLIAAGIFAGLDGKRGLSGWRWLFILEGVASALTALAGLWLLPDTNETTRWLNEDERRVGRVRMERDRLVDCQEHAPVMEAMWSAAKDKRLWLFCAIQNFHYAATSFINFLPTDGDGRINRDSSSSSSSRVIHDLNFTDTVALLLACPPYFFACITALLLAWSSGRYHERTWHITIGFAVAIVGFVIAASTTNTAGRYVACFVFAAGAFAVNSVITGWIATTLSQSQEKKAVALAAANVCAQIGQIYGPYLWPKTDGPRYLIGFSASAGFSLLSLLLCWVMRFLLKRQNRRVQQDAAGESSYNVYSY